MSVYDPNAYIYPGSFDPVTSGHLDVIARASRMCGRLIIAVGHNNEKNTMFTVTERMEMLEAAIGAARCEAGAGFGAARIDVVSFGGLLADFALKLGVSVIIKGLRTVSDFEFEMQMAQANKYLNERMETVFLMTGMQYAFISSGAVREIALHGGRLDGLAPQCVIDRIRLKLNRSDSDNVSNKGVE